MKKFPIYLLFILALLPHFAGGKDPDFFQIYQSSINGKTICFTHLIKEIRQADRNICIRDVKVRWNEAIDRSFMDGRFLSKIEPEIWSINHLIKFENCEFDPDYWLLLRNIRFNSYLSFFHCSNIKIIMNGCIFNDAVRVNSNDIEFFKFNGCTFLNGFKLNRNGVTDQISFQHCRFSVREQDPSIKYGLDMEHRIFLVNNRVETLNLSIENSTFNVPSRVADNPQYFIHLGNTTFNNLRFNKNKVDATIDLTASTIENLFMSYNCTLTRKVIVNALNLNPINTKIQWESISGGKIAIIDTSGKLYSGADANVIKDEFVANELISCYANLYSAFRSQGSRLSANACYVEWKDIETHYLGNIYPNADSGIPLFTYLMNLFLDIFCDYGTNPFQSIIISLYVILGFAAIYYMYPADLRTGKEKDFFKNLKLIAQYYSLPKVWTRVRIRGIVADSKGDSFEEYVTYIRKDKTKAPILFKALAATSIHKLKLKSKFELITLGCIRMLPVNTNSTPLLKRTIVSVVYWLLIIIFLLEILISRGVEAIGLSLNVFSTLGFGNLPERGLPRYMCIAEGFTGWFLLSIFSVALISQVIQ